MNDYLFRYLGYYLYHGARYDELLKQVEDPVWCQAQYDGLGSHAGFLEDLHLGLQVAEARGVAGLPLLIHYSLLEALVRASAGEVRSDDIATQAQAGALSAASERALAIPDPVARVDALLAVAPVALAAGQRSLAIQVVEYGLAAADAIPAGSRRSRAWIDLATVKADLGEVNDARSLLRRALESFAAHEAPRIAQDAVSTARHSASQPDALGQSAHKLMSGAAQELQRDHFKDLATVYGGAAAGYARLGDEREAKHLLAELSGRLPGGAYTLDVVEQLADCALRLVRLGFTDLAAAAIDAIGGRSAAPHLGVAGTPTLGRAPSPTGISSPPAQGPPLVVPPLAPKSQLPWMSKNPLPQREPFVDTRLLTLAEELARLGQARLALRVLNMVALDEDHRLREATLATVLALTEDRVLLKELAADRWARLGKSGRAALMRRLVQVGEADTALALAPKARLDALAELAATLLAQEDARGQAILEQAIGRARQHKDPAARRTGLGQVAAILARAGLPDRALAVWRTRPAVGRGSSQADTLADAKDAAAIAMGLAAAGQVSQALAFSEQLQHPTARCQALAAVGAALARAGEKSRAREVFARAHAAAPGLLAMDDRLDALEALLDTLLEAEEFDTAFQVARSLDRLNVAGSVAFEPGLLFRKAKDVLAQAVGFRADEDVAIDTAPDYQVRVIEAIAEHGDFRLARELAGKIKNISVQQDMWEAIAQAAAAAGDLDAAFQVADRLEDADYLQEELAAQAANMGMVGHQLAAGRELEVGVLLGQIGLNIHLAMGDGDKQARRAFDFYTEWACTMLTDAKDDDVRRMGEWMFLALLGITVQAGFADGLRTVLKQLRQARGTIRDDDVDTTYTSMVDEAAIGLMEAGHLDEARALIALLGKTWPATELNVAIACHECYQGRFDTAMDATARLANQDVDIAMRTRFQDQLAGSSALGQARRGHYTQARRAIGHVANPQLREDLAWAVGALENGAARRPHGEGLLAATSSDFRAASDLLLSFMARALVEGGAEGAARALLTRASALPRAVDHPVPTRSLGWQIEFGGIGRLSGRMTYLDLAGDGPLKRGDRPALALISAIVAAGRRAGTAPPAWLLDIIESGLTGPQRVMGLMALAGWPASQAQDAAAAGLRLAWQALTLARRNGLADVTLHVAGLSPLLYELGGGKLVREARRRLELIKEQWVRQGKE